MSIGLVTLVSAGAAALLSAPIVGVALAVFAEMTLLTGVNRILYALYETHIFQAKEYFRNSLIANIVLIVLLFIALFAIGILNWVTASLLGIGGVALSLYYLVGCMRTRHYTYEVIT